MIDVNRFMLQVCLAFAGVSLAVIYIAFLCVSKIFQIKNRVQKRHIEFESRFKHYMGQHTSKFGRRFKLCPRCSNKGVVMKLIPGAGYEISCLRCGTKTEPCQSIELAKARWNEMESRENG